MPENQERRAAFLGPVATDAVSRISPLQNGEFRRARSMLVAPALQAQSSLNEFEQGSAIDPLVWVHSPAMNNALMTKSSAVPQLTGRNDAGDRVDRFTGCAFYRFRRKVPLRSST